MNSRACCVELWCFFLMLAIGNAASADEPAAKPPEVPVAKPVVREVTDYEEFTGRTESPAHVDLRARVTGYLVKASFREGAEVKKGDMLFEIDPQTYRAELDKAEAALRQAEARLKLAEAKRKRAAANFAQRTVSQEELDKAVAEQVETEAGVDLARAARDSARLNLAFTRVLAPVSGQIGRRLVDPGSLVKADETSLAVLVSREPMHVYFDIDERTFLRLQRSVRQGKQKADPPAAVGLAAEEGFPHRGVVDFMDNRVDPDTGTLRLRAVLANKDKLLLPGMFARVRLPLGDPYRAMLVPEEAVMTEEGAKFVFIVNNKDEIARRPVVLGQRHNRRRVVTQGLHAEDRLVIGRLQALQPGMTVRPREQEQPDTKPEHAPANAETDPPTVGRATGPGILVEAVYPGANAQVVADTIRAPIEQQISSLEKIRTMRSRCTSDGAYALAVTFARGVDLKMQQLFVQNRLSLATPALPQEVRAYGVHVQQGTSGVLMIVNLFSPNGEHDSLYLSNYADIQLKTELTRLPGVGKVDVLGHSEFGLRISIDPDKLAARNLNAGEVTRVIEKLREAGEFDPEKIANLIVKADNDGRVIRLRDVAGIDFGAPRRPSQASLDGKPVSALVIYLTGETRPETVRAALRERLTELRSRFPQGLDLDMTFDFTSNQEAPERPATPEHLLLDLDLAHGASAERTAKILRRCEALLHQVPGVQHTLTLSESPFDLFGRSPCVLIRLAAGEQRKSSRQDMLRAIRTQLHDITEATARLRDLSRPDCFPRCGYAVDLALYGPEVARVREWAKNLGARLTASKQLTDVWMNLDSAPRPQWFVDLDRTKAATLGVTVDEVYTTLQVFMGSYSLNGFHRFGRTWPVQIHAGAGLGDQAKDISKLKVRNARGQMIPLGAFVTVRDTEGPLALDFLDLWPMVQITANPESGLSPHQARKLCETLAEEVRRELRLPAEYRLSWLGAQSP